MIQIRPREGSKVAVFAGFIFEPREGKERGGARESYCREIVIVNLARQAGKPARRQAGQQRGAPRRGPSLTNEEAGLFINLVSSRLLGQISLPAAVTPRAGEGRQRLREPLADSTKPRG